MTPRDNPRRSKIRQVPPTGPSDEALERFARSIADGLRERFPDFDFVVRRRDEPDASAPDDGETVRGD